MALVFGGIGFVVALTGLHDAGEKYTNFLLVIAYWIAPWLGVMFADMILRRGRRVDGFLFDTRHNPFAGWVSMAVAIVVSVWLFSAQTKYTGPIAKHHPGLGDITFEVGFVLAAVLYVIIYALRARPPVGDPGHPGVRRRRSEVDAAPPSGRRAPSPAPLARPPH